MQYITCSCLVQLTCCPQNSSYLYQQPDSLKNYIYSISLYVQSTMYSLQFFVVDLDCPKSVTLSKGCHWIQKVWPYLQAVTEIFLRICPIVIERNASKISKSLSILFLKGISSWSMPGSVLENNPNNFVWKIYLQFF